MVKIMHGAARQTDVQSVVQDCLVRDLTGGTQIGAVPAGVLCTLQNPGLPSGAVAVVDGDLVDRLLIGADHALRGPGGHGGNPRDFQLLRV